MRTSGLSRVRCSMSSMVSSCDAGGGGASAGLGGGGHGLVRSAFNGGGAVVGDSGGAALESGAVAAGLLLQVGEAPVRLGAVRGVARGEVGDGGSSSGLGGGTDGGLGGVGESQRGCGRHDVDQYKPKEAYVFGLTPLDEDDKGTSPIDIAAGVKQDS